MAGPPSTNRRLHRFATFEFDTRSLELWNGGINVPLPDQSAKILATLLARPGDVVTREDRRSFRTRALEALLLALEGQRDGSLKVLDAGVLSYLELNAFDTLIGAEVYAVLGETSRALQWLERAVRNGDERAEWFTRNPALASLRQLPAFQENSQFSDETAGGMKNPASSL